MRSISRPKTVRRPPGDETAGQFSLLFQNNPLPMWVFDRESLYFLEVNEAAARYYGYSRGEFMRMRITRIHPTEDARRLQERLEKKRAGSVYSGKWKHRAKDGHLLEVEAVSRAIRFNGHAAIMVIAQDAAERRLFEQALREREEQYKLAFESASVGLGLADMGGNLLIFNDAMLKPGGYQRDDIWKLGNVAHLYADPAQRTEVLALFRRQGYVDKHEVRFKRKDGSAYDALLSLAKVEVRGQACIQAVVEDITEHKRAERALHEAEERYRTLVEQLPMIVYSNASGDISSTRYVSPQVESILGYSPREWLGDPKFWQKALHPEDRPRVLAQVKRAEMTGEPFGTEYRMLARDGRMVWFRDQAVPIRNAEGKPLFWQGLMTDITEYKRAETGIQQQNQDLILINSVSEASNRGEGLQSIIQLICDGTKEKFDTFGATLLLLDRDRQRLVLQNLIVGPKVIAQVEKILGMSIPRVELDIQKGNLFGRVLSDRKWILVSDEDGIRNLINIFIESASLPERTRGRIRKFLPALIKLLDYKSNAAIPLISENELIGVLNLGSRRHLTEDDMSRLAAIGSQVTSIIKRQLIEAYLLESEERYRSLYQNSLEGIGLSMGNKIIDANKALLEIFGYDDLAEFARIPLLDHVAPGSRGLIREHLDRLKKGKASDNQFTYQITRKDGAIRDIEVSVGHTQIGGEIYSLGTFRDVTQRKRVERELRESEERFRSLYENVTIGLYRTTPDGRILLANPALVRMLGYDSFEELASRNLEKEGYEPDYPRRKFKELLEKDGEVRGFESAWRRRDGSVIAVRESARAIRDHDSRTLYYEGTVEDITQRKQAEDALQASETELRALFAAIPDLILVLDRNGRYLKIAPTHPDLPYIPSDDVLGKRMHDIFSQQKADQFVKYIRRALRTRQPVQFEYAILVRDRIMWFSGTAAPLTRDTVVWAARDITPRKAAEEQVERRLNELEALHESALSLSQTLDPKEIGQKIIKVLSDRLHWHHAAVRVRRGEGDEIDLLAFSQSGKPGESVSEFVRVSRAVSRVGEGLSGWVIQHGRIINNGNLEDDPRYHPTFPGMRSGLYVPIWAGGRVLGCISVESNQREAFTEVDERLLSTLASQAAAALENARLFTQTQRRAVEAAVLYEVTQDLAAQTNLSGLLHTLASRASELLNSYGGAVYLYDSKRQELEIVASTHESLPIGARLKMGEGMAGRVAQSREPLRVDDYKNWEGRSPRYTKPFGAALEVPMLYSGELLGVLSVYDLDSGEITATLARRKFTDEDVRLLSLFAGSAASAVYSAHLFEQTQRRAQEFEALYGVTRDIGSHEQDQSSLLQTLVERAVNLLEGHGGGMYLYDAARNDLELAFVVRDEGARGSRVALGEGAAGRVAQSRTALVIDDYQTWEGRRPGVEHLPFRALIQVPMLYGGELIGVLDVFEYGDSERKFSEQDVKLLSLFASHAASVVHNVRLFEKTRRSATEFASLYETARDLAGQQGLDQLLEMIVRRAGDLLNAPISGIYLYDQSRNDLYVAVNRGLSSSLGVRLALGEGVAGRVAESRQPLIIEDYQKWEGRSPLYEGVPICSVLEVPMLYGGELIGVLTVDEFSGSERKFTEEDAHLLSLFASHAASAIYSARLLENARRRAEELGVLSQVSSALRTAPSRAQMVPIILTQLRDIIRADGAMFVALRPASREMVIELAQGSIDSRTGFVIPAGEGLSAQVLRSRQLYVTADLHGNPRVFQPQLLADVRCAAIVPLIAQDHEMGVLWVTRDQRAGDPPAAFTENEVNLLVAIADMTANAIQRVSLHEQTVHYAEQLVTINAMGQALSQMLDLPGIYEKVSRSALDLLPDTAGVFISLFDRGRKLVTTAYGLQEGQTVNVSALPPMPFDESGGENQSGVVLTGKSLIVSDLIESPASAEALHVNRKEWKGEYHKSALYVPLQAEGQVMGILQLQSNIKNRYAPADAELLGLVANTAAAAIQNARLFAQLRQRVDQLSALHTVDAAISSTTDLRISLQAVLENIVRQLRVDAASVLLLNPATLTLQYIASEGFHTSQFTRTTLSLGKGQAGMAALERRIVRVPDLSASNIELAHSSLVAAEKFAAYLAVPLIAKGEVKGVLEVFHRSPLDLDEERTSFLEMLAGQAALAIDNALLFEGLERANVELTMAYDATIQGWSQALELRDQETQGHSNRVLEMTLRMAAALGISDKDLNDIRRGVLLHDIGKMGIPDSILHKTGPLTDAEWAVMHRHPQYAYDMLAPIAYLHNSLDIPYCHHEKWDGSGYPRALKGETIPLAARIFSVVDVYDALTSDRPYRAAWSEDKAVAYILEQSGRHFDPRIVETFIKVVRS